MRKIIFLFFTLSTINAIDIVDEISLICPIHKEDFICYTSPFGIRDVPNELYTVGSRTREHMGLDLAGTWHARVVAVADGIVIDKWYVPDGKNRKGHEIFGGYIRILHPNGMITGYGHLSSIYVYEGDKVKTGDVIGHIGNTGLSTGQHLHFSVQDDTGIFRNPLRYIRS